MNNSDKLTPKHILVIQTHLNKLGLLYAEPSAYWTREAMEAFKNHQRKNKIPFPVCNNLPTTFVTLNTELQELLNTHEEIENIEVIDSNSDEEDPSVELEEEIDTPAAEEPELTNNEGSPEQDSSEEALDVQEPVVEDNAELEIEESAAEVSIAENDNTEDANSAGSAAIEEALGAPSSTSVEVLGEENKND